MMTNSKKFALKNEIKDLWGFFTKFPKKGHPYSVTKLKLLQWQTS